MALSRELEAMRLYHAHSSHLRSRLPDPPRDEDRPPLRFRIYPGSTRVDLPGRDFEITPSLGRVLQIRRSAREFSLKPLELQLVGQLLHASFGVRGSRQVEGEWVYDRPVPSAGGLYPLELYVATQGVETLPDGLYHYDPRAHQLELRQDRLLQPDLAEIALGQAMIRNANLVVIVAAVFQRTLWKYGERGYRYIWLDAGHLGQNLYLVATALGLGPISLGGFFDEELNRLLNLPYGEEDAVYIVCVGNERSTGEDTTLGPQATAALATRP
jgi:SagB-type dehydrogenase family enzyme